MQYVSIYPQLMEEVLRKVMKDADVEKVMGGNSLMVWSEVYAVERNLQDKHAALHAQGRLTWLKRPGEPR